jgi:hypothetical protein
VRRFVITIAIFLLAGAVVNIGVAWVCAAIPQSDWYEDQVDKHINAEVPDVYDSMDGWRWERPSGVVVLVHHVSFRGDDPPSETPVEEWVPEWSRAFYEEPLGSGEDMIRIYGPRIAKGNGWPLISMGGAFGVTPEVPRRVYSWYAIFLDPPPSQPRPSFKVLGCRLLPFRPIWPGFAFNTVFYGVLLWLLIRGPYALRRLNRRRRGLCPKCAYPMGNSPTCAECGRTLPGRAVA